MKKTRALAADFAEPEKDGWIYEHRRYEKSEGGDVRFALGTKGNSPLVTIGVNPSTATPFQFDRTVSAVANAADSDGRFDSFIMVNLYPQRATDPKNLHKLQEYDAALSAENRRRIEQVLSSALQRTNGELTVWAAWGGLIQKRPYLKECLAGILEVMEAFPCQWVQRGQFRHPHHPLYLPSNEKFYPFDVKGYLQKLQTGASMVPFKKICFTREGNAK